MLHKDFRQSENFKLENILYWALSYSRRIKKIRRFLFQKNSSLFIPIILLLLIKASNVFGYTGSEPVGLGSFSGGPTMVGTVEQRECLPVKSKVDSSLSGPPLYPTLCYPCE